MMEKQAREASEQGRMRVIVQDNGPILAVTYSFSLCVKRCYNAPDKLSFT
ncbi:hypothetical protein H6G76_00345 [Nostoc sp. FACHB-152]|nr:MULTISPECIES: hypothetical protein [unclassified Nostoc]MBD2445621.1 hypothetical protein [Nostoc sp. FACHB-152]MBD2466734.1 hypothetical protein [Nostoc sp. FACHB-145]